MRSSHLLFIAAMILIVLGAARLSIAQPPPPGYRLQETIRVPVDGTIVTSVNKFYVFTHYKLRVSGTATLGPGILGDAEYAITGGIEPNTDRTGSDYKNFDLPQADPALCQTSCNGEAQCQAWTYVKPGIQGPNARCWLKTSVPAAKSDTCCVSGIKGMESDTDRAGSDYKNFDLPQADPALCQTSCNGEAQCQAWTYVKPGIQGPNARCWLKTSVPAAKSDTCCVSGIKIEDYCGNDPSNVNIGIGLPNSKSLFWGSYSPTHVYTLDVDGSSLTVNPNPVNPTVAQFKYYDCDYSDNSGFLSMEVFTPISPPQQPTDGYVILQTVQVPATGEKVQINPPQSLNDRYILRASGTAIIGPGILGDAGHAIIGMMESNTNRTGSDYKNFDLTQADPALCQTSCNGEAQCQAWTYVKPGIQGPNARCWLKTSVPAAKSDACCVSGVKGSWSEDYCGNDPSNTVIGIGFTSAGNFEVTEPLGIDWGPYDETHIYTNHADLSLLGILNNYNFRVGNIALKYYDCDYSDNSGFITVEILGKPIPPPPPPPPSHPPSAPPPPPPPSQPPSAPPPVLMHYYFILTNPTSEFGPKCQTVDILAKDEPTAIAAVNAHYGADWQTITETDLNGFINGCPHI